MSGSARLYRKSDKLEILLLYMPFLNKFNRAYQLQTNIPKNTLIANLQELIDKATKDTKWISFANVDYKGMKLDADTLLIDREGIMVNTLKGRGIITVVFERLNDNVTIVKAEIKPMIILPILWFSGFILLSIYIFILWVAPNWHTVFGILITLSFAVGIVYITITIQRWRLESYLEFILSDLDIKEEMVENE